MSWDGVAMTPACDLADPGWTNAEAPESTCDLADPGWEDAEAPAAACDLAAIETILMNPHSTLLDTGYAGTLGGWTIARMESVCDG